MRRATAVRGVEAAPRFPFRNLYTLPAVSAVRNVLFVMCDQLRRDHLSCYGGRVHTPALDGLAARGVRFDHAYVQAGVCGQARMSFYTGRYVSSHGATWNRVPLSAAEHTLGDYLRTGGRDRKCTRLNSSHLKITYAVFCLK